MGATDRLHRVDLGHDHYVSGVVDKVGTVVGFITEHPDPRTGAPCAGYAELDTSPSAQPGRTWRLVAGDAKALAGLTLEPSLQCTSCGDHGWIKAGKWLPA